MVKNVRMSRKTHTTKRLIPGADQISDNAGPGRPTVNVDVGSGLAPKKSTSFTKYADNTPPPKGLMLPVRGEGPRIKTG